MLQILSWAPATGPFMAVFFNHAKMLTHIESLEFRSNLSELSRTHQELHQQLLSGPITASIKNALEHLSQNNAAYVQHYSEYRYYIFSGLFSAVTTTALLVYAIATCTFGGSWFVRAAAMIAIGEACLGCGIINLSYIYGLGRLHALQSPIKLEAAIQKDLASITNRQRDITHLLSAVLPTEGVPEMIADLVVSSDLSGNSEI
jgi:hypothetical protein